MFVTTCQVGNMTNNHSYITKCHNIFVFGEWLKRELEERKLSQYALAKMIGVTPTHINHIINHRRKPSAEMLKAISRGLKLPVEEVYRRAGILSPVSENTKQKEELIYLFDQFPDNEKSDLITYMQIKLTMLGKADKSGGALDNDFD